MVFKGISQVRKANSAVVVAIALLGLISVSRVSAQETFTFSNMTQITITDASNATPYPSSISVPISGSVMEVTVTFFDFSHNSHPDDVDAILVGPTGAFSILMSDAGNSDLESNIDITFDQDFTPLPDEGAIGGVPGVSVTWGPANYGLPPDVFSPGPGSSSSFPANLAVFNGTNPMGTWNLYIVDDEEDDVGFVMGGWSMAITIPEPSSVALLVTGGLAGLALYWRRRRQST